MFFSLDQIMGISPVRRCNSGFTLIELVLVIVILGILSAFALPRFADLSGDARAASIKGVAGAMRSAVSIARSACAADSSCDLRLGQQETDLDGLLIEMAFGAPAVRPGPNNGILEAAQISSDDYDLSDSGVADYRKVAIENTEDCFVQYNQAKSDRSVSIDVEVSGC